MKGYPYFPMFVDLSEKRVLIAGAGVVAARRIGTLAAFTPFITVIAPEIHSEIEALERGGKLRVLRRRFEMGDLRGADMVLAATDDEVLNAKIFAACRELRIPVNVSSDRRMCDFFFPGIVHQGNVVIGVTASGEDHGMAKAVTARLRQCMEDSKAREEFT